MPEIKGASVTAPIFKQIIKESTNVARVWGSLPVFTNMWNWSEENIANMFTGSMSPQAYAAKCQDLIQPGQ